MGGRASASSPEAHLTRLPKLVKGYERSNDEQRVKDVGLEGEERQAHVGEDEVLRQKVQQLKQLMRTETKKREHGRDNCADIIRTSRL